MIIIDNGQIRIPLEEFWEFVREYTKSLSGMEVCYGVPKVDIENAEITIEFAASHDVYPGEWANPPEFLKEWKFGNPNTLTCHKCHEKFIVGQDVEGFLSSNGIVLRHTYDCTQNLQG